MNRYTALALLIFVFPAWSVSAELAKAPGVQLSLHGGTAIYASDLESTTLSNASVDVEGEEGVGLTLDIFHSNEERGYLTYHLYLAQSNAELKIRDAADQLIQDIHFSARLYQIGGTYRVWAPEFRSHYYGGASIGLAQLDAHAFDREDQFAFSLFGGIDKHLTASLGLQLDVRIQGVAFDSNASVFCAGGCLLEAESDVWWSYHIAAGLYYRFH